MTDDRCCDCGRDTTCTCAEENSVISVVMVRPHFDGAAMEAMSIARQKPVPDRDYPNFKLDFVGLIMHYNEWAGDKVTYEYEFEMEWTK